MPTFDDARRLILNSVAPLRVERVGLLESVGKVLAEDVVAPWNMPRCDNSAMDGYAVRSADCGGYAATDAAPPAAGAGVPAAGEPVRLNITGYIPAGRLPTHPVEPGCAIKIMTGAPIPPGCDAVVPIEQTEESGGHVLIKAPVSPRQQIRFTGEDVGCGEKILLAGTLLHPPAINLLASFGKASIAVYGVVRVAILSTGDELIELGEPMVEGKIVNSNALSLAASVREIGAVPVILGIARDNPEDMRAKLVEGFKADALITSAGVSAGDRDFVRDVLQELQVKQLFRQVDIRPGGPTAFGTKDGKAIFSLPGNPVATMIIFEELVRPALLKLMGHRRILKAPVAAILQHAAKKKPGKIQCLRVRLEWSNGAWLAYSSGDQNTGILKTMLLADGLAILPPEATEFAPGDSVNVHMLSGEAQMLEESVLLTNAPAG
jgi:molybdopterin molybdotransferase